MMNPDVVWPLSFPLAFCDVALGSVVAALLVTHGDRTPINEVVVRCMNHAAHEHDITI